MKPRILVIRGGAIGDFILTLPAIKLLREAFPAAHLEIVGYRHIVALAEERGYADATRSIEYGPMAGFFARGGTLAPEMQEYFASFQQIVSYLFDPDGIFEANVRRSGVKNFLNAFVRIDDSLHAAVQLARPLEGLALYLDDPAATVHPHPGDRAFAAEFLRGESKAPVAIHPGSGSPRKNWAAAAWAEIGERVLAATPGRRIVLIGGEADRAGLQALHAAWGGRALVAQDLPLPHLAAVLEKCALFLGHDSGISHLAAATGTRCVLLFGPTDPAVWAPVNSQAGVVRAPGGDLAGLAVDDVWQAVRAELA
jgi:heptosyltransferase-3